MTEEIETLIYNQVAKDLLQRFGRDAFDVAEEARVSLKDLGDKAGEEIWSNIAKTLGMIETGMASSAVH